MCDESSITLSLFFSTEYALSDAGRCAGITCFLVERSQPGLSVGKEEQKMGLKASRTCTVHLDGVRVPKSRIVGEVRAEIGGFVLPLSTLRYGQRWPQGNLCLSAFVCSSF